MTSKVGCCALKAADFVRDQIGTTSISIANTTREHRKPNDGSESDCNESFLRLQEQTALTGNANHALLGLKLAVDFVVSLPAATTTTFTPTDRQTELSGHTDGIALKRI